MKLDPNKWPELKKAWDDYGHAIPFEKLDGIKSDRGCYCVVRWKNEDGTVGIADLARGRGQPWEMQNDGFSPDLSEADWRKLSIVPDCDWFVIAGHPQYGKGLS